MLVRRVGRLGVAVLLILACAGLLCGPSYARDPVGKLSVAGRFGVSGYDMGAINSAITRSKTLIASFPETEDWEVPDRIHSGLDFVADACFDLNSSIRLGLIYGRSAGETSVDYLQRMAVKPRATMIVPRLFYKLPWRPMDDLPLRLFGGLVFLSNAKTIVEHENTSEDAPRLETLTIKGSGTGFTGGLLAEYALSDRFVFAFEGGYRIAKASFDSGAYTITKLHDALGDDDNDGIPNNRDLYYKDKPAQSVSYLWGFMEGDPKVQGDPGVARKLDTDFSGLALQIGLRVYIF